MSVSVLPKSEQGLSTEEISRLETERTLRSEKISRVIRYIVLFGVGVLMLYPLVWMVFASFKPNNEIFSSIGLWSDNFSLNGFVEGWKTGTEYTFATYLANSFKFVIPKVILTVISSTLVAYGFARFEVPGKKIWFSALMTTVLLPGTVLLIPQYIMFREFGMLDSMSGKFPKGHQFHGAGPPCTDGQLDFQLISFPELGIAGPDTVRLIEDGALPVAQIYAGYVGGDFRLMDISNLQPYPLTHV